jgi:hypothetical protein
MTGSHPLPLNPVNSKASATAVTGLWEAATIPAQLQLSQSAQISIAFQQMSLPQIPNVSIMLPAENSK